MDLCAGSGGKTGQLAERMHNQGKVLAVDRQGRQIRALQQTARRMGYGIIETLVGDGLQPDLFSKRHPQFDRILIDAPCSGWGTIRRNPDLKWRLRPEDGSRLAAMQNKFLQNAAGWLKSGGVLVYCTCTLNPQENQNLVEDFLKTRTGFRLEAISAFLPEPAKGLTDHRGFFRTWPPEHDMDGFFAARLRKI